MLMFSSSIHLCPGLGLMPQIEELNPRLKQDHIRERIRALRRSNLVFAPRQVPGGTAIPKCESKM